MLSTAGEAIPGQSMIFIQFLFWEVLVLPKKQLINANSQLQDKIDHCYCVCLFEQSLISPCSYLTYDSINFQCRKKHLIPKLKNIMKTQNLLSWLAKISIDSKMKGFKLSREGL